MDSSQTNDHDHKPRRRLAHRWMPSRRHQKTWEMSLADRPRRLPYLPHPMPVRRPR